MNNMTQFSKEINNIRLTDLEKLTVKSFLEYMDGQELNV
jgi:hypothetical protein